MSRSRVLNTAAFVRSTRMAGPGLRDAIWVQGCTIGCRGCANRAYQPHVPTFLLPVERLLLHFRSRRHRIDGISVLGGEPTEQAEAVGVLLSGVRKLGLSTVVYSGRTFQNLRRDSGCSRILANTDLLIDGPFIETRQDPNLHWRGSDNQRLIRLSRRFMASDLVAPRADREVILTPEVLIVHGL